MTWVHCTSCSSKMPPDLFPGFADEGGHDGLTSFEVTGGEVPGAVFVTGVPMLAEEDFGGLVDEQEMARRR